MTHESRLSRMLHRSLALLKGKKCWGIVAGEGTGSIVGLDFGEKVLRLRPVDNPHLTDDERRFEAEMSVLVSCSWRLDSKLRVLTSSTAPNTNHGPMVKALELLRHRAIESMELSRPGYDLELWFRGGLRFRVFCDQVDIDGGNNYSFFVKDRVFTVGPKGRVAFKDHV